MRNFLLIASFAISLTGFSQFPKALESKTFSTAKKENFNGFLGENSLSLFTIDYLYISRKKQEINIRKFSRSTLELVEVFNVYSEQYPDYYNDPLEIFYVEESILLFSRLESEKNKTRLISIEVIDETGKRQYLEIIDTLTEDSKIFIEQAQDKSGFIIAHYNRFQEITEQEIHLIKVENNGHLSYKTLLTSPMALQDITIEKAAFTKNSPVYLLCNNSQSASITPSERGLINNKYSLWSYDRRKNFLKEFDVRMKAKFINGVEMKINDKKQLILSGYFNETRNYAIGGVFSLLINQNLKVVNSGFQAFEAEELAKFLEERDRNKVKELADYSLHGMHMLSNGSYFITGEHYYKFIERNYDPRTNITTTTEHYNYNAIIVSYFDSLGREIWTDKIPKYQSSTNDGGYFSSFCVVTRADEIILFFNDNEKNNEKEIEGYFNYSVMFNNRKFQISAVRINRDGIQERGALIDASNSFILRAKESDQINNSTMYLMGESGRDSKIFAIPFD